MGSEREIHGDAGVSEDSGRIVETAESSSRIGYKNPAGNTSASTADLNATGENVDSDADDTNTDEDVKENASTDDDDFGSDRPVGINR